MKKSVRSVRCAGKCDASTQSALGFLRIVSDENRLKTLCLLNRGERCVCGIWQELEIPQNLASHHLKVLKDFDLLNSEKVGLKVIYRLNGKTLLKYQNLLNHFLNPNPTTK